MAAMYVDIVTPDDAALPGALLTEITGVYASAQAFHELTRSAREPPAACARRGAPASAHRSQLPCATQRNHATPPDTGQHSTPVGQELVKNL